MPSLVIVESPAKAQTISRFLGDDFIVEASVGVDPRPRAQGARRRHRRRLPAHATSCPRSKDVVRRLKAALKDADQLYLATDEDREGEAIAWHLTEVLKPRVPTRRMVFHEITRQAIEQAVERVARHRQRAWSTPRRRGASSTACSATRCPRCCGARSSTGLSAGRVQSPAVRLVVERERERMAFVVRRLLGPAGRVPGRPGVPGDADRPRRRTGSPPARTSTARVRPERDDVVVVDETGARALVTALDGAHVHRLVGRRAAVPVSSPKPPFITSTLQQEGGRKLGMSVHARSCAPRRASTSAATSPTCAPTR